MARPKKVAPEPAAAPVPKAKAWTAYDPAAAQRLCARLMEGPSLITACREPGMPAQQRVFEWLKHVPAFAPMYREAREIGYMVLADELLEIADDGRNDWMATQDGAGREGWKQNSEAVQRSRLRADTRKWILAKALPKIYGEPERTVRVIRSIADLSDAELAALAEADRTTPQPEPEPETETVH